MQQPDTTSSSTVAPAHALVPVAIPRHSHSLVDPALQSSDPNSIRIPSYSQSLKVYNLEPVSRSQKSHAFPPKITSQ